MEREHTMKEKDRRREGPAPSRILTLAEAAEILHTSYSTVYRLVTAGELDAFRLRNSWRTSTAACDDYVSRQFAVNAISTRSAGSL